MLFIPSKREILGFLGYFVSIISKINLHKTRNGATSVISAKIIPHHNKRPIPLIIANPDERTPDNASQGFDRSQSILIAKTILENKDECLPIFSFFGALVFAIVKFLKRCLFNSQIKSRENQMS